MKLPVPVKREDFDLKWFNRAFNPKGIQVHSFKFMGETGEGRGFMGTLEQVELQISKRSNASKILEISDLPSELPIETLNVVLKTLPKDPNRKKYAANDGFSSREVAMYTEVFEKWEQFMNARNVPTISRFRHPICYYGAEEGHGDSYNYLLVLENLTAPSSDFVLWTGGFTEPLPWAATIAVIRQIARFHATGLAYKTANNSESYSKQFPILIHTFGPMFKVMWDDGFKVAENVIKSVMDASEIPEGFYERFNELKGDTCKELVLKWFTDPTIALAYDTTICHHDLHSQNLCLSQNHSQAVLFDFQACCVFNPMKDLSFFLILNLESEDVTSNLSLALESYYEEFKTTMSIMEVDFEYSLAEIRSDYDRFFAFSLVHIITGAPIWISGANSSLASKRRFASAMISAFNNDILRFPEF